MAVVWLVLVGILAFAVASVACGLWLRRHPAKSHAERESRGLHFLFFALLECCRWRCSSVQASSPRRGRPPTAEALRRMGDARYVCLPCRGCTLLTVTNKALRALGSGANAFRPRGRW